MGDSVAGDPLKINGGPRQQPRQQITLEDIFNGMMGEQVTINVGTEATVIGVIDVIAAGQLIVVSQLDGRRKIIMWNHINWMEEMNPPSPKGIIQHGA